ncbi:MAG: hypothetical protein ACOCQV_00555 [Halolamina sp.]
MNFEALLRPFLLYTALLGLLTAGAVTLVADSGFVFLFRAGGGLLLAVLGVGRAGAAGVGGVETGEGAEMGAEDVGVWPGTGPGTSLSLVFLFYGIGLLFWSFVVLDVVYDVLR